MKEKSAYFGKSYSCLTVDLAVGAHGTEVKYSVLIRAQNGKLVALGGFVHIIYRYALNTSVFKR